MKISFNKPYITKKIQDSTFKNIKNVFNKRIYMLGNYSRILEQKFAEKIGVKYAVTINSGTTGLQIALRFAEIKNKEVLVPAASFITNVSSVIFEKGKPILVDCDKKTLTFDLKDLKKKINKNTKAIVWVHLTGFVGKDYEEIIKIANDNNLLLIEDSSHAHGSLVDNKYAGSLGDIGVFSFYPTKVLTCGSGGIITTNNKRIYEYTKSLRLFGKNPKNNQVEELGNDWFLDEFRCSILLEQFNVLDDIVKKRNFIADYYYSNLPASKEFHLLERRNGMVSPWYNFPLFFKSKYKAKIVSEKLSEFNIPTKKIYRPVSEELVFRKYNLNLECKKSSSMLNSSLCLPIFPNLKKIEMEYIVNCFSKIVNQYI